MSTKYDGRWIADETLGINHLETGVYQSALSYSIVSYAFSNENVPSGGPITYNWASPKEAFAVWYRQSMSTDFTRVSFPMNVVGSPSALTLEIYDNDPNSTPNLVATADATVSATEVAASDEAVFTVTGFDVQANTNYWFNITMASPPDGSNYYKYARGTADGSSYSYNGSAWSMDGNVPWFKTENAITEILVQTGTDGKIDSSFIPDYDNISEEVSEEFTLTSSDITNKYVALSNTPVTSGAVQMMVVEGAMQNYGEDFAVVGGNLSWDSGEASISTGMVEDLIAGDVLRVWYEKAV